MRAHDHGFTILEALVALVIIAVSLGAVVVTVGSVARNETRMQTKTFARWVAMNQLEKLQIEHAWPAIGTTVGTDKMARQKWKWSQKTQATSDEDVRRVEVSVWLQGAEKIDAKVMMIGFIGHN